MSTNEDLRAQVESLLAEWDATCEAVWASYMRAKGVGAQALLQGRYDALSDARSGLRSVLTTPAAAPAEPTKESK